jgi:hypothetical protein
VSRRKKLGRPSLGVNARTNVVPVKLSDTELAAIKAAVAKENAELLQDGAKPDTTVSSWMRDHALDPLGMMPRESAD